MNTSNRNYWLKSGLLSLMEKFSVQLFAFGSVFVLFRALTKEQFGAWAIFLTIVSVVEVARIGLLQNALVKFLSTSRKEEYADISTASLLLNLLLTVLTVTALVLLSYPTALLFKMPALESLLKIYAATNIVLIPFFQFNYVQQANLDFRGIFWSNFSRQCLFFLLVGTIFLFSNEINLVQLAFLQIIAAALGSLVAWLFCRKYISFSRKIDWEWVKKLFKFGKYVLGTNAATMLFKSTDKFLLGALPGAGPVGVALYESAIKVTNLTDVPTFSMASILFPQSARRAADSKSAVKELYEKAVGAILSLMVPAIIFIWIFAEQVILIVAGSDYLEAVPILRLTMLYGLFMPYAVQFGTVLDSIGLPRTNFIFTLANLLLLGVIDYFFIMKFGTIGAAWGTLLTYAITFCAMQYFLYKKLNVNPLKPYSYIFFFYKKGFSFFKKTIARKRSEIIKTDKAIKKQAHDSRTV